MPGSALKNSAPDINSANRVSLAIQRTNYCTKRMPDRNNSLIKHRKFPSGAAELPQLCWKESNEHGTGASSMQAARSIDPIIHELQQHADPSYRDVVRDRYNMQVDHFLGVRTPIIHRIADRHYRALRHLPLDERLALGHELLETRVYEHKIVAFRWGHLARRDFLDHHFPVLASWLDSYVDDWIDCDDLCIHVLGEFLLRYPQRASELQSWTTSANRWVRRGAAVALILPARKGQQLDLVFEIADRLVLDHDDLVQKGYGWLLKEASKQHPRAVFEYVTDHRHVMSRTAFRYALEKLPPAWRQAAMSLA
jgi:3-methyladenine DNA glycosylase AlkD